MNHMLKIDERAFNRGVREVLKLKPLVRVVKKAVFNTKEECKQQLSLKPRAKR